VAERLAAGPAPATALVRQPHLSPA
jgi:hypothetical protein